MGSAALSARCSNIFAFCLRTDASDIARSSLGDSLIASRTSETCGGAIWFHDRVRRASVAELDGLGGNPACEELIFKSLNHLGRPLQRQRVFGLQRELAGPHQFPLQFLVFAPGHVSR